jgi:hypothetical protein
LNAGVVHGCMSTQIQMTKEAMWLLRIVSDLVSLQFILD